MARFADGIEKMGTHLEKLNIYLMGRMDEDTGRLIPGLFARVDEVETVQKNCIASRKSSKGKMFGIFRDIGVTIATGFIIWKLGIK
jgi:hypothetical protein